MVFFVRLNVLLENRRLSHLLVFVVILIHVYPFLSGYRLSADDVAYHWYAMRGMDESWQFIKSAAIAQGRIVHFPDLITSLIGAYFADCFLFRLCYVLLYFANFILFTIYIARLFNIKFVWFFILILFILHPLDYYHMSPGAYPFKISFPVFLILLSRMQLMRIRSRGALSLKNELLLVALCFSAMMFSEYSFLFALSLMVAEFSVRTVAFVCVDKQGWCVSLIKNAFSRQTLQDLFIVLLFCILYIAFRLAFPSSYDGNVLPSKLNILLTLKTMAGHILGGSVFSSFGRYNKFRLYFGNEYSWLDYLMTVFLFLATFISSLSLVYEYRRNFILGLCQRSLRSVSFFSLILAFIVTFPVAITDKYQSWCGRISHCVFLDSSLSYFGFGSFLSAVLLIFILNVAQNRRVVIYVFSFLLACIAAAAQINNLRLSVSMSEYVMGWDRAKALSSYADEHLSLFYDLSRVVEPFPRISFHPGFDILNYWRLYINDQREGDASSAINPASTKLFPDFFAGKMYFSNLGEGIKYLTSGWSRPERWGVWADGNRAEIVLPLKSSNHLISIEVNAFVHALHPFQRVDVAVNGIKIENLALSNPTGNLIQIDLAEVLNKFHPLPPFAVIQFTFKDAVSPFHLGISDDNRLLSIGLISLEIR